jgi:AraC-like DNA-binding protein
MARMQVYTCAELMSTAHALGGQVDFDAGMADATPVLSGWQQVQALGDGLVLYLSQSRDMVGGSSHNRLCPGITAGFLVQGQADVAIGGTRLQLSADAAASPAMLVHLREEDHFLRHWQPGRQEAKVSLHLSDDWLRQQLDGDAAGTAALARVRCSHAANQPWLPPAPLRQRALQLFECGRQPLPLVGRLQQESFALELAADVLQALARPSCGPALSVRLQRCVSRLQQWLESGQADGLSINQMARQLGTNAVDLQRGFQHCHGLTIAGYLRQLRLQRAHRALQQRVPVEEAAAIAGYAHASSFSAAYKRQYGYPPSRQG